MTTGPPLVGAHRGLGTGAPENTIAAVRSSSDAGVDIIELDLRRTSDGVIVVIHDEDVNRTTDGTGKVGDLTFRQLRRLKIVAPETRGPTQAVVPSLREILDLRSPRNPRILLDIKGGRRVDVGDIVRLVHESGEAARVIFGVRRLSDLRDVRANAPDARTLAFVRHRSEISAYLAGGADIVRLWTDWIVEDPGLIDRVHAQGRQVWALVGRNVPSRRDALVALHEKTRCSGVDGIITDTPRLLLGGGH